MTEDSFRNWMIVQHAEDDGDEEEAANRKLMKTTKRTNKEDV